MRHHVKRDKLALFVLTAEAVSYDETHQPLNLSTHQPLNLNLVLVLDLDLDLDLVSYTYIKQSIFLLALQKNYE